MSSNVIQHSEGVQYGRKTSAHELDSVDTALLRHPYTQAYPSKEFYIRGQDKLSSRLCPHYPCRHRSSTQNPPLNLRECVFSSTQEKLSRREILGAEGRNTHFAKTMSKEYEEHAMHMHFQHPSGSDLYEYCQALATEQHLLRVESDEKFARLSATCDELRLMMATAANRQKGKSGKPKKDPPKRYPRTREDYIAETKTAPHFKQYAEEVDDVDFGYKLRKSENKCRLGLPQEEAKILRDTDGDDLKNKLCSKHRGVSGGTGGFKEVEERWELDPSLVQNPYSCKMERK